MTEPMAEPGPDDERARVERVMGALRALGYAGDVTISAATTHTAEDAAAAAGCELGAIVKTLAVYVAGAPMLCLVPGDRRLDDRLLAARFGTGRKQVKLAGPAQVIELTGYPIGGVSPFGTPAPLPVLIDDSMRRFDVVWIAAGTASAILPIRLDDLAGYVTAEFGTIAS